MDTVKDLSGRAGLPLGLNLSSGKLHFGEGVMSEPPGVRTLSNLRPVLADREFDGPELLYRLYRGVRRRADEAVFSAAGLRYDVTVILPGFLGREFVKTAGHYHLRSPAGPTYPEIYEVLHGRAAFILQWADDPEADTPEVGRTWVAICGPGEKILIPPDCGHVSVNIGVEPLVVADLVSLDSGHLYGPYLRAQGAAFYMIADSAAPLGFRCEPNSSYGGLLVPEVLVGSRWEPFRKDRGPVYAHLLQRPKDYAFLNLFSSAAGEMYLPWIGAELTS